MPTYLSRVTYLAADAEGETNFAVPFNYLRKEHVKVYLRPVAEEDFDEDPLVPDVDFTWSGDAQIVLEEEAGAVDVLIRRETPRNEVISTHQPGNFSSDNANLIDLFQLYIEQEIADEAIALAETNSKRTIRGRHGEVITWLEPAATRADKFMAWDPTGLIPVSINVSASAIGDLSEVIDEMLALSVIVDDILAVSAIVGSVVTVAANVGSVSTVAANIGAVVTVAGSIANVNTVAGAIGNINILAPQAANIAVVAAGIANVNTVAADLALGGGSLIATAGSVVAAIQALLAVTPLYTNENGQGARSATMRVYFSAALLAGASGTPMNLINGDISTNSAAQSLVLAAGIAVAGHQILFDNLEEARKLVTEFTWRQQGTATHGVWQGQVLTGEGWTIDETTGIVTLGGTAAWVSVGGTFTLGGSATQVINAMAANTYQSRIYRFLGVSGTTGTQYIYEVEQKIGGGVLDRKMTIPVGGLPGDRWEKTGYRNFQAGWVKPYGDIPVHAGVNRLALWMFDERETVGQIKNKLADTHHFDYRTDRAAHNPNPLKTKEGYLFLKSMIRQATTSLVGIKEVAVLMRPARGNNSLYEISTSLAGEPIYMRGSDFRNGTTVRVMMPNGEIMPAFSDNSGSNSAGFTWLNRGGWVLAFIRVASALAATRLGIGGDPDATGTNALYANRLKMAYLSAFDADLSDAQCKVEADWLLPQMAAQRDITIRNTETKTRVDIFAMMGQSNIGGDAPLWDTPRQLLSMRTIPAVKILSANRRDRPYMARPSTYDAGTTSLMGALQPAVASLAPTNPNYAQHDDRKYGADWQLSRLWALEGGIRERIIFKVGADGTTIANGAGEGGGGTTSWHPSGAVQTGMHGWAMTRLYDLMHSLLNQGIGFDIVASWWGEGETTSNAVFNSLATTNWSVNYTALQAWFSTYTAGMWPARRFITRLRQWEAGVIGDPTKIDSLRAQVDALGAADPTNVKIVNADSVTPDVWGRTPGFHPEVGGQLLHFGGALLDDMADQVNPQIPWSVDA